MAKLHPATDCRVFSILTDLWPFSGPGAPRSNNFWKPPPTPDLLFPIGLNFSVGPGNCQSASWPRSWRQWRPVRTSNSPMGGLFRVPYAAQRYGSIKIHALYDYAHFFPDEKLKYAASWSCIWPPLNFEKHDSLFYLFRGACMIRLTANQKCMRESSDQTCVQR